MELGKTISEIRKEHGLTQEEFAGRFNVTRQTISNWETGKSYPDLETLVLISDDFHVSLDTMLKGDRKMVREITKEQKHGRNHRIKIALIVALVLAIVAIALFIMNNTVNTLDPEDYIVSVKEITPENVTIDEVNKIAVYTDPEGGDYINEDETREDGVRRETAEESSYVFKGEEYAELMTNGHAYELIITSDHGIDGYFVDSDDNGTLSVSVWRSNMWFLGDAGQQRVMLMWFDDFDKILDSDTGDVVWEK